MTYREKLQQCHPECVDKKHVGGCKGCPGDYFKNAQTLSWGCAAGRLQNTMCAKCWNQEAPEERNRLKGKTVYIAGPITGVDRYWEAFEKAEDTLTGLGCLALNPAKHPKGMTNAQYMRLSFAMIDTADAVLFLPGWAKSEGASLEHQYCMYTDKPCTCAEAGEGPDGIRVLLEEVLG